jgi:hypothetical protein
VSILSVHVNLLFLRNSVSPVGCKRAERSLNKRMAVSSDLKYVLAGPSDLEHKFCPAIRSIALVSITVSGILNYRRNLIHWQSVARMPSENYSVRRF